MTLQGQGTDAGGGATRKDLKRKLADKERVNDDEYNDTTCALHALNMTLESPTHGCTIFSASKLTQ